MRSVAQLALIDVRYFCHKGMYQGRGDPRKGRDDFWNIFHHLIQQQGIPEQFIHCVSCHGSAIDKRYQDVPQHEDDIDLEEAQELLEHEIQEKASEATLITSDTYVFGDFVTSYLASEQLSYVDLFLVAAKKIPHLQLLSERMMLVVVENGTPNYHLYATKDAVEEYGQIPWRLFRALVGDGCVQGIKGFAEKSAAKLLTKYASIPEIMRHLDDLKPGERKHLQHNPFLLQTNFLATSYYEVPPGGFTVVTKTIPKETPVALDTDGRVVVEPRDELPLPPPNVAVVEPEPTEFNSQERLRHYIAMLASRLTIDFPVVVFDTETTGVNTETDRIVQFFGLRINPDLSTQTVEVLINPEFAIPEAARAVHGITDQMVANAPIFADLALAIHDLFHGAVYIVGFNHISFDVPLLINEFKRAEMDFDISGMMFIDVLKLESTKLTAVYKRYTGENLTEAHGAGADTIATLAVLTHQLTVDSELAEMTEWADLEGKSRGKNAVDLSGKLTRNEDGVICFNIKDGVKGTPVAENTGFANWMLSKDFPADTKAIIREELEIAKSRGTTHVDVR